MVSYGSISTCLVSQKTLVKAKTDAPLVSPYNVVCYVNKMKQYWETYVHILSVRNR
jgi:hypothetical protein